VKHPEARADGATVARQRGVARQRSRHRLARFCAGGVGSIGQSRCPSSEKWENMIEMPISFRKDAIVD
jgi:hypothetical protein